MAVGADHHPTGEGVLLQYHLVDNPGAGLPEPSAIAGRYRGQEVVDLSVAVQGSRQVLLAVIAGLNEVVTMGGCRNLNLIKVGSHELEPCHLGRGVLHGHPVGP